MSDRFWLYGLLIILVASVAAMIILSTVYAETEKECVKNSFSIFTTRTGTYDTTGECDWLVNKILSNGSGFELTGYSICDKSCYTESFILTKKKEAN